MKNLAPVISITDELQCEGCAALATLFDEEGVPLCAACAESHVVLVGDAERPNITDEPRRLPENES